MEAIECNSITFGNARVQYVKDKTSMPKISKMLSKPIVRYKSKSYLVLDGDTAYVYEESPQK